MQLPTPKAVERWWRDRREASRVAHKLKKFMRCERMQRFPAALEPRRPCPTPHDEVAIGLEQTPRFPQEAHRIPRSFDAVKKRHIFKSAVPQPARS